MTELCDIATRHNTDKAPWCWGYTAIYHRWLSERRNDIRTVLEVGVYQGASLRTWRDFFPNAMVWGFDNDANCVVNDDRIHTFCCNAYDPLLAQRHMDEIGPIDFFVDDALHFGKEQITLLQSMWPYMRDGGVYAIEECRDDALQSLLSAAISLPGVVRLETIYAKDRYSLTLLQKGAR